MPRRKKPDRTLSQGIALGILATLLVGFGVIVVMEGMEKDQDEKQESNVSEEVVADEDKIESQEELKVIESNADSVPQEDKVEKKEEVGGPSDEETETEIQAQSKEAEAKTSNIYQNDAYRYQLVVPENWDVSEPSSGTTSLYPENKPPTEQFGGDVVITYKKGVAGTSNVEEQYDGKNDVNLFTDATGGSKEVKISGVKSYLFYGVEGYVPSDVLVVPVTGGFLEITDVGAQHQNDGVFEQIVNSIELK